MRYYDAHNHLQDPRLDSHRPSIVSELSELGVAGAVVNGTREEDWNAVAALGTEHPWVVPSFGLHPWFVLNRSERWLEELQRMLDAHPRAAIGEIGLDRWIKGHDLAQQKGVFAAQLELAAARNLPVTIHCLQAWGALWEILRDARLPARGFLLHAYGGSPEMARGFLERGAYFSFSTYFLHDRKEAQREVFRALPAERLLVETDAPDMAPPAEKSHHCLVDLESGKPINHPANLLDGYECLARLRGLDVESLADQVEQNFQRFFVLQS